MPRCATAAARSAACMARCSTTRIAAASVPLARLETCGSNDDWPDVGRGAMFELIVGAAGGLSAATGGRLLWAVKEDEGFAAGAVVVACAGGEIGPVGWFTAGPAG